ncbi:enoyl-CoA hydratase/isomerase family protein [Streptomyces sp. CWNU-52B]|uniref:enoyl-CoA hydratase/isomerase family protein n=1 Tax=unclassified Streptomyces TaxID=2593676 RepID=UPI0039BEEC74
MTTPRNITDLSGDGLRVDLAGHVAVVELRRPPANFFDEGLVRAVADAVTGLGDDPRCRVIVLCSEGKHFCAGADFGDDGDFTAASRPETSGRLYREAVRIFRAPKPIVAAVQGAAVGGGLGLACAADFRVTEPGGRFAANFSQLGFHPGFGLSVTLPRIVGVQKAADLFYSGRRVRGTEAVDIGLADRLTEPGTVRTAAVEWAQEIARSAPLAVRSVRATLRAGLADEVEAAVAHELREQQRLWSTEDSAEGIAAGLARRAPRFTGR